MKRFRTVTILSLAAISIMVCANVVYLCSLYGSIKEQSIHTATECLRRAAILEIISRMRGTANGDDDSFIRLTLMVEGEKSADGTYSYPNLLENLDRTMSDYFHFISSGTPGMPERNLARLEQIYRKELAGAGLNPTGVIVADSIIPAGNYNKFWNIRICSSAGEPLAIAWISPLTRYVFSRMAGIIITSALILLLMFFLIAYLIHWVGKLRTIEQMKDDFTHNMTHELKTPVAVAYSAADSMLRYYDQSDEARNRKLLSIIMQRLSFLGGMIENILSMSMERFRTMRLNRSEVPLKPLVEEIAGLISMKTEKPVQFVIDIADECMVNADALHFGNVISNLLDNAVKYSTEAVMIKIYGDNHGLSIADNGIGISKKNIPHIFDKFYRVVDGDRYEVGGYGLGLYYVRQIVTMHGWGISVDSEPGHGTIFTIKFDGNDNG